MIEYDEHRERQLARADLDLYRSTLAENAPSNRHPAACAVCGGEVPAGAGSLTKGARGLQVRHVGRCPERAPEPELVRCRRCSRPLRDIESRELGIGPECRKRH